jgi:hypothetical protein
MPVDYARPATPGGGADRRPSSVRALAAGGIVLGFLGFFVFGFSAWLGPNDFSLHASGTAGAAPVGPPPFQPHGPVGSVVSALLWLTCLLASVAAMSFAPRARQVLLGWSSVTIVWAIVQFAAQVWWVIPARWRIASVGANGYWSAAQGAELQRSVLTYAAVALLAVSLVLPIGFLLCLTRPSVRAAFRGPRRAGGPAHSEC